MLFGFLCWSSQITKKYSIVLPCSSPIQRRKDQIEENYFCVKFEVNLGCWLVTIFADDDPARTGCLPASMLTLILLLLVSAISISIKPHPQLFQWCWSQCHNVNVTMFQYNNETCWSNWLQGSGGLSVGWDLDLLHVNDIHVRMEETNKYSAACRWQESISKYYLTKSLFHKFLHGNSQRQARLMQQLKTSPTHSLTKTVKS